MALQNRSSSSFLSLAPQYQDMLDVVDMEGRREPGKVPLKVGGFDLIWDGGPVLRFDRPTSLPTMLGAYNERDKNQMRVYKVCGRRGEKEMWQYAPGEDGAPCLFLPPEPSHPPFPFLSSLTLSAPPSLSRHGRRLASRGRCPRSDRCSRARRRTQTQCDSSREGVFQAQTRVLLPTIHSPMKICVLDQ
jgi:hypothetical protein